MSLGRREHEPHEGEEPAERLRLPRVPEVELDMHDRRDRSGQVSSRPAAEKRLREPRHAKDDAEQRADFDEPRREHASVRKFPEQARRRRRCPAA